MVHQRTVFAQGLIAPARPLYAGEPLGLELDQTVYAFDSTTIDLCLALFPWAPFRQHKSAIKLHTLLDLRGSLPPFVHIPSGKVHDVNLRDERLPEPGAIYYGAIYYLECRQDPGLDSDFGVCHGRDSEKKLEIGPASLHNSTDFEPLLIRKKADFAGIFRCAEHNSAPFSF